MLQLHGTDLFPNPTSACSQQVPLCPIVRKELSKVFIVAGIHPCININVPGRAVVAVHVLMLRADFVYVYSTTVRY